MFVPVGIFDDHLHVGIDPFRRFENELPGRLCEQAEPEIRPALVAFGLNALFTLAACKEKIIQYDLVKVSGGEFNHFFEFGAVLGIGVAVGLETVALVDSDSDTAGGLDPALAKEFFSV